MEVGDLVSPAKPGVYLRSGSESYPGAVVANVNPFVIISCQGDMMWSLQKEHNFKSVGKADEETMKIVMERYRGDTGEPVPVQTLSYPQMLSKMIALSATRHEGVFDMGGRPYILHPMWVASALGEGADLEVMCIAWGHDLVEDCGVTYAELRAMGFSERIIEGIQALTKVPGETYEEYKAKVMSNLDAIEVKIWDLTHNSRLDRLKGVTAKDIDRTIRYQVFYRELKAKKADFKLS